MVNEVLPYNLQALYTCKHAVILQKTVCIIKKFVILSVYRDLKLHIV